MTNQSFIITGGSKGLGRALAFETLKLGYSVAIIGRSAKDLEETKAALLKEKSGTQIVSSHQIDLTQPDEVTKGFKEIFAQHKRIRGLVNNAGTWLGRKEIKDLTLDDIKNGFELNFYSAFSATQETLQYHRAQKEKGELSIIFIGATASQSGRKTVANFCLSKGAMRTFAQSLAREVAPEGIHVSHIIVDGVLDNPRTLALNPTTSHDQFMKQDELSKTILSVMLQDRSCWTFELDTRAFTEPW